MSKLSFYVVGVEGETIIARINEKNYVYVPTDKGAIPLCESVQGMCKHSVGKALAYLKKHAVGTRLA